MQTNDSTYLLVPQKESQPFLNVDVDKPSKIPIIISLIIIIVVVVIIILNEHNNVVTKVHTRWNLIGTLVKSIGIMIAILLLNKRGQQNWVISLLCVDLFPLILFRDTSLYHIIG
jgi:hypothetical protein